MPHDTNLDIHANQEVAPTDMDTPNIEHEGTETLASIRELVLRANPEVVPEMIAGETIEEILDSVDAAHAAWQRIVESTPRPSPDVAVPAGGDRPMPIDPDRLPSSEKIRRGLAQHR